MRKIGRKKINGPRIHVQISKEEKDILEYLAFVDNTSSSAVIRNLIDHAREHRFCTEKYKELLARGEG